MYVFVRSGGTWTQEAYIEADNAESQDRFGNSIALGSDVLAVGHGLSILRYSAASKMIISPDTGTSLRLTASAAFFS